MPKQKKMEAVPHEAVEGMIYVIRGQKVMIDHDLASLYGVATRRLNEQVRRNIERFPEDFMFQLTKREFENLKSHFAISSWGGRRKPSLVFTEHGVAMLSSVLNSKRAIQVNITIMRTFSRLKEMISAHKELACKMKELERKVGRHDEDINAIIDIIKRLAQEPERPKRSIGFHVK